MRLVIFGATGKTGILLLKDALEAGHSVTAFVRDPLKLTVKHPNLSFSTGNVSYPQAVDNAVKAQDAVFICLGTSTTSPNTIRSEGTKHIIQAMQKHGVKRLIVMTTIGTHESWKQLSLVAKAFMGSVLKHAKKDHELQEDYVKESGLDWTIVRPSRLTDDPPAKRFTSGIDPNIKASQISRANVAGFMLAQLESQDYLRKAVAIT